MAKIEDEVRFEISLFSGRYIMSRTGMVDISAEETLHTYEIRKNPQFLDDTIPPELEGTIPSLMEVSMYFQNGFILEYLMSISANGWYKPNSKNVQLVVDENAASEENTEFIMCSGIFTMIPNMPVPSDIFVDLGMVSTIRPLSGGGTTSVSIHEYMHNTLMINVNNVSIVMNSKSPEISFCGFNSRGIDYIEIYTTMLMRPILMELVSMLHLNDNKKAFDLQSMTVTQFITKYKKYMQFAVSFSTRWVNNAMQVNMIIFPTKVLGHDIRYNITTQKTEEILIGFKKESMPELERLPEYEIRRILGMVYGGTLLPLSANGTVLRHDFQDYIDVKPLEDFPHPIHTSKIIQNRYILPHVQTTEIPPGFVVNPMFSDISAISHEQAIPCMFSNLWDPTIPPIKYDCYIDYAQLSSNGGDIVITNACGCTRDTMEDFHSCPGYLIVRSDTEMDPEYGLLLPPSLEQDIINCIATYFDPIDPKKLEIILIPMQTMPTYHTYMVYINWPKCTRDSETPKDEKGIISKNDSLPKGHSKPPKRKLFQKW